MERREALLPEDASGSGETLQREIRLARNIQMKLLNGQNPELPIGEATGISIPARLIGGDYFDFYPLGDGRIRIVIADVMGKGIPAAMLMILTRSAFRYAAKSTAGPGETLAAMNDAMFADLRKLGSFVTAFCADWDPATGNFRYASAGHPYPIIVGMDSTRRSFSNPQNGVMLGGLPNQTYGEGCMLLRENELVFFYTDGIVESQNRSGEMFRVERLTQAIGDSMGKRASDIEADVLLALNGFTEGMPQRDDITMVILRTGCAAEEVGGNFPLIGQEAGHYGG